MHKMTEENIKAAFAGESQAHVKYLIFADRAEKEHPEVARMFRAFAFAEQTHAATHLKNLGGIGDVLQNLDAAIGGETFEVEEMYPAYRAVAEAQSEKSALRGIDWALEAEKVHAELYRRAKEAVSTGSKPTVDTIHVCANCGYTTEGEAPDRCPLCNASRDKFRSF